MFIISGISRLRVQRAKSAVTDLNHCQKTSVHSRKVPSCDRYLVNQIRPYSRSQSVFNFDGKFNLSRCTMVAVLYHQCSLSEEFVRDSLFI